MKTSYSFRSAYTLIELLISITLSLFLLLGVTEMFRHVGSTMSDTQKSLNMSSNLNAVAMTLRSDLGKIDPKLAHQPHKMTQPDYGGDTLGYLEITEGMGAPYSVTVGASGDGLHVLMKDVALDSHLNTPDLTVGDVDDILAFTAQADPAYPFRGFITGPMKESLHAEIVWFVRGTNLYRRVLLLDSDNQSSTGATPFYKTHDISVYWNGSNILPNTMQDLTKRENRFAHYKGTFPYPLYATPYEAWYYLRMPTLEETVHSNWPVGQLLPLGNLTDLEMKQTSIPSTTPFTTPFWDFWLYPDGVTGVCNGVTWNLDSKTGTLCNYNNGTTTFDYIEFPPRIRAGDDIILKNVISFDVKVWNPYWVPCVPFGTAPTSTNSTIWVPPQYIDLGQDRFFINDVDYSVNYLQNLATVPPGVPSSDVGYGFTLKGRYNTHDDNSGGTPDGTRRTFNTDTNEKWHKKERLRNGGGTNQLYPPGSVAMPCVFDSWTTQYELDSVRPIPSPPYTPNLTAPLEEWSCPPPYSEDLQSIQITIRCFEPQSGNIKQVRVVQQFPDNL